jgi:hypothetical protein
MRRTIICPFFKQPSSSTENGETNQSESNLSVAKGTDDLNGDSATEDEIEKQILKLRRSKKSSQSEDLDEAL